jgi:hypothetical protein
VLSSRPIPACVDAFVNCKGLRLQELTYEDITSYVHDKLENDPNMKRLIVREEVPASEELVATLVDKASGVFLWVKLAVRSLLDGLRNYDGIEELQRRLVELPPDLETFYDYMIKRVPSEYRHQAAQMFRLVLLANEHQAGTSVLALQLSYAADEEMTLTLSRQIAEVHLQEAFARIEVIEGRIRSRCCGLLELTESNRGQKGPLSIAVSFFHRTVVEFLRVPRVWEDVFTLTQNRKSIQFDPALSLLASEISLMKVIPIEKVIVPSQSLMWSALLRAMLYASHVEDAFDRSLNPFLDEVDRVVSHHWTRSSRIIINGTEKDPRSYINYSKLQSDLVHRCTPRGDHIPFNNFLKMAVDHGLSVYVDDKVRKDPSTIIKTSGHLLLKQIVSAFLAEQDPGKSLRLAEIVSTLLQHGADPNRMDDDSSSSAWSAILEHALNHERFPRDFLRSYDNYGSAECYVQLLPIFICAGAKPNLHINVHGVYRDSALNALEPLLSQRRQYVLLCARDLEKSRPPDRVESLQKGFEEIKDALNEQFLASQIRRQDSLS